MATYPIITDPEKSDLSLLARAIVVLNDQSERVGLSTARKTALSQVRTEAANYSWLGVPAKLNAITNLPTSLQGTTILFFSPITTSAVLLLMAASGGAYRVTDSAAQAETYLTEPVLADMLQNKRKLVGSDKYAGDIVPSNWDLKALTDGLADHNTRLAALEANKNG